MGDIVPKLATPKDYEYLLLCDGSSFDTTRYPLLAEIFTDGKLPDLRERVLQGAATAKQYREAGLPNITGSFRKDDNICAGTVEERDVIWGAVSGAFSKNYGTTGQNTVSNAGANTWEHDLSVDFNASRSSAIYGKSSTVQPPAYTVNYYVCYGG